MTDMAHFIAQGVPGLQYFEMIAIVFAISIVAGLAAIVLQPTSTRQPFRLILAIWAVGSGIALPIAAYIVSDGGLIGFGYPVLAIPLALGLIALQRRVKR